MKRFLPVVLAITLSILAPLAAFASTPSLTASWNAVTTADGGAVTLTSPVTYNLYQGTSCSSLAIVQGGLVTTSEIISSGLTPGVTYCFAVTAVANGIESAKSNTVTVAVPFPTPDSPTQITIVLH